MKFKKQSLSFYPDKYELGSELIDEIADKKFLHVGYPRTGSTFLRKDVLPHLDFSIVVQVGMVGNTFYDNYQLPQIIAKTAAEKVSITIRSQYSIIPSYYSKQYVKLYGKFSYGNFLDTIIKNDKFNYYKMVERLCQCHKTLGVFLFEDLKSNQEKFLGEFISFFDPNNKNTVFVAANTNRRYPLFVYYGLKIRNKLNIKNKHIYHRFLYKLNALWTRVEPLFGKLPDAEYIKEYREKIRRHYSESNDKLFSMLGRPKPAEYP